MTKVPISILIEREQIISIRKQLIYIQVEWKNEKTFKLKRKLISIYLHLNLYVYVISFAV